MWKMDLPKSTGALLRNPSKVLLNESKTSQAAQKRDYNDEHEFVHMNICSYPLMHVCTACER